MDSATENEKSRTPMQDVNDAYKAIKFGYFHIKLLCVAFVGIIANVLVTGSTAFLLPSAECDLNMNLIKKGLLNATPYVGMLLVSAVAGFLTDTFGRKMFLKIGFGGMFFFTIIAGSSQTYEVLLAAKFFEGAMFAISISASLTLTSEFCHTDVRDQVVLCQSSLAAAAQIVVPAMAWGVLTNDWRVSFFDGRIVLNTWNFYLYIMSLWSLVAFIMYSAIPESPKYLITQKKYAEAKEILIKLYKENTGKPAERYPCLYMWEDEIKREQIQDALEHHTSPRKQISNGLINIKVLFRRPMFAYLILIGFMNLMIVGKYNVLRLWFPQLSTIVERYNIDGNNDLCVSLDKHVSELKLKGSNVTQIEEVCVPAKSGTETYINSIIMGCVCILPYFITGVLVNRVGKKVLLVVSGLICIGSTVGLRWANSKTTMVALFSIVVAVTQTMKSLVQASTVELFPTSVRTLAVSLTMSCARIGTLIGNVMFPILLDRGCVVPFFTMAGVMSCVTVISMFLPKKKAPS
ncbi:hypothetical protein K1T71_010099 [Dendrolimus kikuchii]|uniref:Uncharacterized protein n=1 Tax=Dendrolimus kikuchii TaxID=765133 RepID=A0ACC1CQZ8_9NEOP|nr:hypothetical protein K1T71_010099 [Dendrolimus kikuchii]